MHGDRLTGRSDRRATRFIEKSPTAKASTADRANRDRPKPTFGIRFALLASALH